MTTEGPSGPGRWTRVDWAFAALLCLVTCAHWLPRLRGPIDLRYDAGVYYVLGTALAQGQGYRLLNEPGEIEAIQYPPLLPAYVALHQRLLGSRDPLVVGSALRRSSFALSLLYGVLAYALARRWLARGAALFAGAIAACYFHTIYLEDLLFAEVPFALVTTGFFLAASAPGRRLRALAWPLAGAAFFLRTAGLALFAAWSLDAALARRWKSCAARTLFGAACVLAWQAHVWSVRRAPEYAAPAYAYQRAPYQFYNVSYAENLALIDPFKPEEGRVTPGLLAWRVLKSVPRLVLGLGESVSAPRGFWEWPLISLARRTGIVIPTWLVVVPLTLLSLATAAGLVLLARAGQRTLSLFVLCSLGLIALLPWPAQFPRYLAPLTPVLALGLTRALGAVSRRAVPAAVGGLVLCSQAFAVYKDYTAYHRAVAYERPGAQPVAGKLFLFDEAAAWYRFHAALWWLRANTPEDALVATSCPHLVWIHTGRKAVMPPLEAPDTAQVLLESAGVDYVVIDELSFVDVMRRYIRPAVERFADRWELAYQAPHGNLAIYRRRP